MDFIYYNKRRHVNHPTLIYTRWIYIIYYISMYIYNKRGKQTQKDIAKKGGVETNEMTF